MNTPTHLPGAFWVKLPALDTVGTAGFGVPHLCFWGIQGRKLTATPSERPKTVTQTSSIQNTRGIIQYCGDSQLELRHLARVSWAYHGNSIRIQSEFAQIVGSEWWCYPWCPPVKIEHPGIYHGGEGFSVDIHIFKEPSMEVFDRGMRWYSVQRWCKLWQRLVNMLMANSEKNDSRTGVITTMSGRSHQNFDDSPIKKFPSLGDFRKKFDYPAGYHSRVDPAIPSRSRQGTCGTWRCAQTCAAQNLSVAFASIWP